VNFISTGNIYEDFHLQIGNIPINWQHCGLQNALFRGSRRASRVCSGIPGSYGVAQVLLGHIKLVL